MHENKRSRIPSGRYRNGSKDTNWTTLKPKPKPSTHPEQKPAPTLATQFVEAPTIPDNELLSTTEEEQPGNDANRISANINDDLQYSFDKLQQKVGKFTLRFHDFCYHICLIFLGLNTEC